MPCWLQYIDFFLGVIGFIITIATLKTAASVKRTILHKAEIADFLKSVDDFINQIDGFISSINDDQLYSTDGNRTFKPKLIQFFAELSSRFSFFPWYIKRLIHKIVKELENPNMLSSNWNNIAKDLIKLKNSLRKEHSYNG